MQEAINQQPVAALGQYRGLEGLLRQKQVREETIQEQLKQRARRWNCEAVTDEVAKAQGYESLQALKDEIIAQRSAIYVAAQEKALCDALLAQAAKNLTVTFPEGFLQAKLAQSIAQTEKSLRAQGTTLAQYLALMKQTKEQYEETERNRIELEIRISLALVEIAKAEGITVSDAEIDTEYQRLAALRNRPLAAAKKGLTPQAVAYALSAQKVRTLLRESANMTVISV